MFLQGDETITLAPAASTVETISGVVADQTGSGGTRSNAGAGGLILDDPGTLDVDAANTFTRGTTIDQGVLELAKATAAGSGGIDFASTSGEVECAAGALANTITGFTGSDEIDFSTIAYTTGDHAVDNAGSVGIETSAGVTVATFKVNGTYTSANFKVGKDPSGDVLVTYAVAAANAAIDEIDGGSFADLLGRYAQFPMPIAETHNGLVGLEFFAAPGFERGDRHRRSRRLLRKRRRRPRRPGRRRWRGQPDWPRARAWQYVTRVDRGFAASGRRDGAARWVPRFSLRPTVGASSCPNSRPRVGVAACGKALPTARRRLKSPARSVVAAKRCARTRSQPQPNS